MDEYSEKLMNINSGSVEMKKQFEEEGLLDTLVGDFNLGGKAERW